MATGAAAADYPTRPIRFVVPSAPGGGPDTTTRIIAPELGRLLGQQVIVDNRPGANGVIGTEAIATALPDGYTIGMGNTPTLAVNRTLLPKLPYDTDKDLRGIVLLSSQPNLLAVAPVLPVKSVRELIDYAKDNPGKLIFGSPGSGSTLHLSGELFKLMTGVQMMHVPYKAALTVVTDLIGGRVHLMFNNMSSMLPYVTSGRVRGLAVTGPKRSPAIPELPTVAEAGVPGFEVTAWAGIVAPTGVPKSVVDRLNAETNRVLADPGVRQRMVGLGYEIGGGTPEQFTQFVKKEVVKWADVVKRSGAKVE